MLWTGGIFKEECAWTPFAIVSFPECNGENDTLKIAMHTRYLLFL